MYEEKIAILKEIFPDFILRKGGTEFVCRCPSKACKSDPRYFLKRKLEISLSGDFFACWRCHYRGHMVQLLRQCANASQKMRYSKFVGLKVEQDQGIEEFSLPTEYKFVLDHYRSDSLAKTVYDWLINEGVSEQTILQNRVGYLKEGSLANRVIFPSYDENCELNYFTTRHLFLKNQYRWLKCSRSSKANVWNELFIDWNRPLIVTESVKTYLKFFDKDKNIVCNNGVGLNENYKLFSKILMDSSSEVIVAFDPGTTQEAFALSEGLSRFGRETRIARFSRQPDEVSEEEFDETISAAKIVGKFDSLKYRISKI
jgi:hypothetical protein